MPNPYSDQTVRREGTTVYVEVQVADGATGSTVAFTLPPNVIVSDANLRVLTVGTGAGTHKVTLGAGGTDLTGTQANNALGATTYTASTKGIKTAAATDVVITHTSTITTGALVGVLLDCVRSDYDKP